MSRRSKEDRFLSRKERQRFDAMAEYDTVKHAALRLGISEGTLNNWNYKLRKRLRKERGHLNACLAQMKRSKLLKEVLSVKKPMKPSEWEKEAVENDPTDWGEEEY